MANGQNNNQQEVVVNISANTSDFNQSIQKTKENLERLWGTTTTLTVFI